MKSYLDLITLSAQRHKRQGKMTLFCIILSVFLVTVIFGMAEMAIRSQQYQEIKTGGNWHVIFSDIDEKTGALIQARPEVTGSGWYGYVNETKDFSVDGRSIAIAGIDEQAFSSMFLSEISEGSFPNAANEVVLSEYAKSQLGMKIGNTIQIDGISAPLVITGFAENSAKQMRMDTFSALLNMDGFRTYIPSEDYTEQLVVQLSTFCNMQKVIADITEQLHLSEEQVAQNGNLLAVLGQSDNNFIIQLYGCAVVLFLLVLIASVLMITSSLNSNVMQRTEFFGMLRCIGATKKQIMKFVRREGLRWCKFAIPIGLICGIVVVWVLCAVLKFISPDYFSELPVFRISWIGVFCGILIGFLTVLLAARAPAKKAASVSPLTAVSGNAFNNQAIKTAANTRLFHIDTSLGVHHSTTNRKNFLLMISSFALSIILFLAFSTAIDFMNHAINALEPYTPDVSIVSTDNTRNIPKKLLAQYEEQPFVKCAYGRMFAYDIPTDSEDKRINLISYEEHQFSWAEENLVEGSIEDIESSDNAVLAVYNSEYELHTGDTVAVNIEGQQKNLEVVGVLSKSPFTNMLGTANVICTEDTFEHLYGETQYTIIDLQFERGTTDEDADTIREMSGSDFGFSDCRQSNQQSVGTYYSFALFVYGFLVVIALITVFNIVNSINMSVSARIRQYGAMRAIGMSNRQLIKMVTAEAATYSLVGCVIGCVIGLCIHKYLFTQMVSSRWGDPWNIPVVILGIIVILVILTAFIAVRNPAKRIRNLSIIDTISEQ